MNRANVLSWLLPVILSLPSSALAQSPQRTTATYGDWILRCELGPSGKVCGIAQSVQLKGNSQPLTQIEIARPGKSGAATVAIQVPIDVWLNSGVALVTADGHSLVTAQFNRCVPAGCIAEAEVSHEAIEKLGGLKKNGKLSFESASKKSIAIPVSFKGFKDAYAALMR